MQFSMAEKGSVFSTPERAIGMLAELEQAEAVDREDRRLVLDFDAVTHVSDSFANGFVGTVFSQRRSLGLPDPEVVNTTQFVRKVIDRTLKLRKLDELEIAA